MRKPLPLLSLAVFVVTLLWLVLLVYDLSTAGPLETYAQVTAHLIARPQMALAAFLNAALITLLVAALFAVLYHRYAPTSPRASAVALVFVPVYCTFNLAVYLLQISAVPALLPRAADPAVQPLLSLLLQGLPGSAAAFFNNLAYALLGIPSIIFGLLMAQENALLRIAGRLLVLNGLACIAGWTGLLINDPTLSQGSLAGGVIFLGALGFMAPGFREK